MTDIIVTVLSFLSGLIEDWFPAFTLGDGVLSKVVNAFAYFVELVCSVNWLVPVQDALLIIGLITGYYTVMFLIFCGNWIIRRIFDIIP